MKILNSGSLNIDYVYRVKKIVTPGETIRALPLLHMVEQIRKVRSEGTRGKDSRKP